MNNKQKQALQAKAVFGQLTLGDVFKAIQNRGHFDAIAVYVDDTKYDIYSHWKKTKSVLELSKKRNVAPELELKLDTKVKVVDNIVVLDRGKDMHAVSLGFREFVEINIKPLIWFDSFL